MPTLSYDTLPPGSDLSQELTADGVTIMAAVREPSARTLRWTRRTAAVRAIADSLIVTSVVLGVTFVLLMQLQRPPNLPAVVYPIAALFVAAVYLLAWKLRADTLIDALHAARTEVTILAATPSELRIEVSGPLSTMTHRFSATDLIDIRPSRVTLRTWWSFSNMALHLTLRDGRTISVLSGRDEFELNWAAAVLRQTLGLSDSVVH